ncbi:beta strand repeat-containing protein, partial [Blastomonas sp.]|uniref:beta strand repeat-containing protein n=1 Tax=Blastomonas sp. TaxID=1909299 RepID=UPI00359383B5
TGGSGGNGGFGVGGTINLVADGGQIVARSGQLIANGAGSDSGVGGSDGAGARRGASGLIGNGSGGTISLVIDENNNGIDGGIAFEGSASLIANGSSGNGLSGIGGTVFIVDEAGNGNGGITLGSLAVEALGFNSNDGAGFFVRSTDGAIMVESNATINVGGSAGFNLEGTGGFEVRDTLEINAARDVDIQLFSLDPPDIGIRAPVAITGGQNIAQAVGDPAVSAGNIRITAGDSFTSNDGVRTVAADSIRVRAEQNIFASDLQAGNDIFLSAGTNVGLVDVLITGIVSGGGDGLPSNGNLVVQAGLLTLGEGAGEFGRSDAEFFGNISVTGLIDVAAGGSVLVRDGAQLVADNAVQMFSGDDIIIEAGALVSAASNPLPDSGYGSVDPRTRPSNLRLVAGAITPVTPLEPGNISTILIEGRLESLNASVVMSADAIQALSGEVDSLSLFADIVNAPANGEPRSDDGGRLTAQCVEGNICLASIRATEIVEIGQSGVPIDLIVTDANVSAQRVAVTTRTGITLGREGVDTLFSAGESLRLQTTEGNIELLGGAQLTSGEVRLFAEQGSLLGNGIITSGNDIGISVADSISASVIDAGGGLFRADAIGSEGPFELPGDFNVGFLGLGNGDAAIIAGRSIQVGQVSLGDRDVRFIANGAAFLGGTSGVNQIDIEADSIEFGEISAGFDINLNATSQIFGQSAEAGGSFRADSGGFSVANINASSLVEVTSGEIDFGGIFAGGDVNLTSGGAVNGQVLFGSGFVTIDSFGGITLDQLAAGFDANLFSSEGGIEVITDTNVGGMIDASALGMSFRSEGGMSFSSAEAREGNILLTGGGGTVAANNVLAAGDIVVVNQGDVLIGSASAGFDGFDDRSGRLAGGAMPQFLTPGEGMIDIAATGSITLNADVVAKTDLVVNADGLLTVNELATGSTIFLNSGDIAITETGRVGSADQTQSVSLRNNSGGTMTIGGAGVTSGYSLSNAEAQRIVSNGDLTLIAPALESGNNGDESGVPGPITGGFNAPMNAVTGPFALVLDTLTISVSPGSGSPGGVGMDGNLVFLADGIARVVGAVTLSDAINNALVIDATGAISVNAATGRLAAVNNNAPSGRLSLRGQDIFVLTDSAFADIQGLDAAGVDARLAQRDTIPVDTALLRAGGIVLETLGSDVLIQNTAIGTDFADRRGFVAGAEGISVRLGGSGVISINGIIDPGGTPVTGVDVIAATTITGPVAAGSTINGCLIADPASCQATPPP